MWCCSSDFCHFCHKGLEEVYIYDSGRLLGHSKTIVYYLYEQAFQNLGDELVPATDWAGAVLNLFNNLNSAVKKLSGYCESLPFRKVDFALFLFLPLDIRNSLL